MSVGQGSQHRDNSARMMTTRSQASSNSPTQFTRTARASNAVGFATAVLTNDLALFFDDEWIERIGFLDEMDVVVDCSRTGVLKPDPAAYQLVLDKLGVPAESALFVDDQRRNICGSEAVGMPSVWFDVTQPVETYREVHRMLGLDQTGPG